MDSVVYPTRITATAVIPNGSSVSGAVVLGPTVFLGFTGPAAWTTAALNIEVMDQNGVWITGGLFDSAGAAVSSWAAVTAAAAYSVDTLAMLPWRTIRFRSGTASSAVTQLGDRSFGIITRAFA